MKSIVRWAVATSVLFASVALVGNSSDIWLWAYAIVFSGMSLVGILSMGEDLARERFTPPSPGADRLSLRTIRLLAVAHLIVGLLDSRYGWTSMPPFLRAIGIAGFAACFLTIVRAMRVNRFFSGVVRIQAERGHHLIDRGPYAVIRHPGYAAMIPLMQFSALALGSWIAFAVAFVYTAWIVRRVVFEDRFLQQNLAGYSDYAGRVPYRLIPRVW